MTTTPPWMTGGRKVNCVDYSHMVPHYDIHGFAHHRNPYKDKSHLNDVEIRHHKWLEPAPAIKSRAELQQARKRGRIPDPSYDFDGDGVVSQLDYFVGRTFDKDCDGRLTPGERRQAEKALNDGFLNKYVRGLDSQGDVQRAFPLQQKRGVILTGDNNGDVAAYTYPRHFNADHVPKHNTKTTLEMARLGERKGAGAAIGERYIASNEPVPEPVPPNHATHPRTCEISHIRERAEADHQLARVRGGLFAMNSYINPERECRQPGLEYDPAPPMATRSQLLETRKEGMRRECEEQRTKCDDIQVPLSVRRTAKEALEFDFRRGGDHAMTLTKLKDRRRRDKIEYDMDRFQHKAKTFPKFSDRSDVPFWINGDQHASEAPIVAAMPRTLSEPTFKVHELPFGDDAKDSYQTLPDAAYMTAAGLPARIDITKNGKEQASMTLGSSTKKGFTAEMIERGFARNCPRLFDSIQPLHTGPRDMESLDVQSSMAPIRENALKKNAEQRRRNAETHRRSMLWSDSSCMQQSASAPSQAAMGLNDSALTPMDGANSSIEPSGGRMQRSASVAPTMRTAKVVMSETMRGTGGQVSVEPAREPKFFGTMPRSFSDSGVRCGGFQRLDWPVSNSRQAPAADLTKKRGRDGLRDHSTSTMSAQPL